MSKPKLLSQEQGFTLTEVLVAILIISIFIAVAMQSMVFAAYFQARGKQYAEAITWIQEDLEEVRYQASQLPYDAVKCNAPTQDTGFAHQLRTSLPALSSSNPNIGTKTITGKTYVLYRDGPDDADIIRPNVNNTAYEVMQVKYEVKPQSGGDAIATMYTEVIPDVAFRCP